MRAFFGVIAAVFIGRAFGFFGGNGYGRLPQTLRCDQIDGHLTAGLVTNQQKIFLENLSLPLDYDTLTLNDTYVLFPGVNGSCYMVHTVPLYMETGEYMGIYDANVLDTLNSCDLIIGTFLPSLYAYTYHSSKIYLATTPLPYEHEHERANHEYVFSMWPSYHTMLEAVQMFMEFQLGHEKPFINVLILRYVETVDGTNYVNALYNRLLIDESVRFSSDYSILPEVKKLMDLEARSGEDDVSFIFSIFHEVRELFDEIRYDLVILLLDADDPKQYINILKMLFSKEADLEHRAGQWLIPDLTFGHRTGVLEGLIDVNVIQTKLTFIQHKPYDDCEPHGLGVEQTGLQFAVKTLKEATSNMDGLSFTINKLWKRLREKRRSPAYDPLSTVNQDTIHDGTYPRYVQLSFVDYATTKRHVTCPFETTAIYINRDHPASAGLGQGVGGLADAKTIENVNKGTKFYGLIPPDSGMEAVIVIDAPYVMASADGVEFEGIAIDIFNEMRKVLMTEGIFLNLKLRRMDYYGQKIGDTWNGIFGELQNNRKTKVALGQISITPARQRDFHFTPPFGFIHRTYLIKKQEKEELYVQFARPFTSWVWLGLLIVVLTSAFYIFLLDHWNPFRDEVPKNCRFNSQESLWYSYLTMCHMSAPFSARNLPIRIFSIFYWFFSLVVVGSYTGNLASCLTDAYFQKPSVSSDIRKLPRSGYRFGCIASSSTSDEMHNMTTSTGETLYDIIARKGDFVENYEKGFQRVRNEKYILIGTSGVMSHFRNTDPDCKLELNMEPFYSMKQTEIGFAMKSDWELKDKFSDSMAYLMESGRIASIYNKWMKQGNCESNDDGDSLSHFRLDFKMLVGLFIMLVGGCVLSYICLFLKLTYLKITGRKKAEEDNLNQQLEAETQKESVFDVENQSDVDVASGGDAAVSCRLIDLARKDKTGDGGKL